MRILIISGEFPPMQGGVGDFTQEIARAFSATGHDVWIVVPRALADDHPRPENGGWRVLPVVDSWSWGCWRQVRAVLREISPDVINIQYQAAAYDMRIPAINLLPWHLRRERGSPPTVVTFHDLKPPYLFPKAGPLRAAAVRVLARYSDAAILTNTEDAYIARSWPFVRRPGPHPLHQIPIGSNIAPSPPPGFIRDEWRARLGYGPNDTLWAYFGFLNETKGGETLIHALARAPSGTQLLMIGDRVGSSDPTNQSTAARVERLIDELDLAQRVRWTGYLPRPQVSAALLSADAVVLPYRDGASFRRGSLHAALAHGCAVVSTEPRIPVVELRNEENILLVAPDNPADLAQAASRLTQNAALQTRIRAGASALAAHFTWEQIAQRTVEEAFAPLIHHSGNDE